MNETIATRMLAPDVGTIITVNDPTQFSNAGGNVKGKRTYRVNAWFKAAPAPQFNLDTEEGFDAWFETVVNMDDALTGILDNTGTRFPQFGNIRLMWCTREEAEYVCCSGVAGGIFPINEVTISGRVSWSEEMINDLRSSALRKVGNIL